MFVIHFVLHIQLPHPHTCFCRSTCFTRFQILPLSFTDKWPITGLPSNTAVAVQGVELRVYVVCTPHNPDRCIYHCDGRLSKLKGFPVVRLHNSCSLIIFFKPMAPTCNRPACNRQYPHSMGEVSQFIQFTLETSSWTRFPYLSKYFLQEFEKRKCMVTQHIHWCVIVEGGETWKGSSRPCDTLMGERDAF